MSNRKKQRVFPISVPWMVSPSVPRVRVAWDEQGFDAKVTFVAEFPVQRKSSDSSDLPGEQIEMVGPEYGLQADPSDLSGQYQLVEVLLYGAAHLRIVQPYTEFQHLDPEKFDMQAVDGDLTDDWSARFQKQWLLTGRCPDPGFYEVKRSWWLEDSETPSDRYTHCIVVGHDAYVEILAERWEWKSLGTIHET